MSHFLSTILCAVLLANSAVAAPAPQVASSAPAVVSSAASVVASPVASGTVSASAEERVGSILHTNRMIIIATKTFLISLSDESAGVMYKE